MKLFSLRLIIVVSFLFSFSAFAEIKTGTYKKPSDGVINQLAVKKMNANKYMLTGFLNYGTTNNSPKYTFPINAILTKNSEISYNSKSNIEVDYEFSDTDTLTCKFEIELRMGVDNNHLFITAYFPNNLSNTIQNHQCPTIEEVEYAWITNEDPYVRIADPKDTH